MGKLRTADGPEDVNCLGDEQAVTNDLIRLRLARYGYLILHTWDGDCSPVVNGKEWR